MEGVFAFLGGVVVGVFFIAIVMASGMDHFANRALSCMAAGNTVEQCQDILGIVKN